MNITEERTSYEITITVAVTDAPDTRKRGGSQTLAPRQVRLTIGDGTVTGACVTGPLRLKDGGTSDKVEVASSYYRFRGELRHAPDWLAKLAASYTIIEPQIHRAA